jgi:hypothetical protein
VNTEKDCYREAIDEAPRTAAVTDAVDAVVEADLQKVSVR